MTARLAAATHALAGSLLLSLAAGALLATPEPAGAQIAGQNVNMVSGMRWPGGDPYLQRQNEPSIAVSSWNAQHLVAGANDYRTVDIPNPNSPDETGDAWHGVFKSFNGGQSWQSTLLPGYPQDTSAAGAASPLFAAGYTAGADPVVRSGTNGMFYLGGIAFKRGTNLGAVFVARYQDLNNKENGDATAGADPIKYLDTTAVDTGSATVFIDKPWVAVDAPRAGALTCTIPGTPAQSFPGGLVYLVYQRFYGAYGTAPASSDVMLTRSRDCGATWSTPLNISDATSTLNQGATVAVDPVTGDVYVAWRRFASGTQSDAIMVARSFSAGAKFTRPRVLTTLLPFDQDGGSTLFRMETLPTIAVSVDATGTKSWAHVAWTGRPSAGADARVVVSSAVVYPPPPSDDEKDDSCQGWSAPVAADAAPLTDDAGTALTRGHQFMPQLTFSQGRLMLVYYDTRLDHAASFYRPNVPFAPDAQGHLYARLFAPVGELVTTPSQVYTPLIDEAGLTQIRHTVDVRVGSSPPGPSPSFTTVPVSQYAFGTRGDEVPGQVAPGFGGNLQVVDPQGQVQLLQQLQGNPPNLPIFAQGTVPFIGDYIDIQGRAFVPAAGGWSFNTAPSAAPVFHAVWTTNQDVRPPPDGDWRKFTPPGGGGQSVFDPSQTTSACVTGFEGTRNQNIYTSRVTEGLEVSSPQNAKPLGAGPAQARAFVVVVRNATAQERAVRFSLAVPAGVSASFRNDGVLLQSFDVAIAARTSVQRALFVYLGTSTDTAASVTVNVSEVQDDPACLGSLPPTCALVAGGLSGFVTLNPPGSVVPLVQPDNAPPLAGGEVYTAVIAALNVTNPNVTNPNVTNPNVTNPNVTNLNVTNPNVTNPNVTNLNVTNPNVTNLNVTNPNVTNLNVTNLNVTNPNVTNPNVTNLNVTNPNVTNSTISDALFVVTSASNTTHSYRVVLVGNGAQAPGPIQLIVSKTYTTPLGFNCQLLEEPHSVIVANVGDVRPYILPSTAGLVDPNIPDPSVGNATVSLAPGESAQITLRGALSDLAMSQFVNQVVPAVVAHAGGPAAIALLVTSDGTSLPAPRVGSPYGASLQAVGGTPPYAWAVVAGGLPPGLALGPSGQLTGIPTGTGTFAAAIRVTDSASPPASAQRPISLSVVAGPSTTTLRAAPASPVFGQPVTLLATISAASPGAGVAAPSGTVTFTDGTITLGSATLGGSDGTATASLAVAPGSLGVGSHAFSASFAGDGNYAGSATASPLATAVGQAATVTALSSAPAAPVFGQPVTLTALVTVPAPGAGTPTGTVTFSDGASLLGTASLDGQGGASLTTTSLPVASHALTATYGGDSSFRPSGSAVLARVVTRAGTTTSLASSPNPSTYGAPVTLTAAVAAALPGAGAPGGTVTFADGGTILGTTAIDGSGKATLATSALGAGTHAITATSSGDGNFTGSVGSLAQPVARALTSTAVSALPNPGIYGQPVTIVSSVSSGGGTPTGSVALFDGTTSLGPPVVLSTGSASLAVSLGGGLHALAASYPGDANFAASTSAAYAEAVNAAPTATLLSSSASPSTFGLPVTFTAAVSSAAGVPQGFVAFSDGATALGTLQVDPLLGTSSLTTATLAAGTHAIQAAYSGDGIDFAASSATVSQAVNRATTATGLSSSANPSAYGQPVTLTATVTVTSGAGTLTGTVTFLDGPATLGSVPLTASRTAALTLPGLASGTHAFTATYSGDGGFAPSSSGVLAQVVKSPYIFVGFLSPLTTAGTPASPSNSGTQKLGRLLPIQWELEDLTGTFLHRLSAVRTLQAFSNPACAGPPPAGARVQPLYPPPLSSVGALLMVGDYFRYTWNTSTAGGAGCYDLVLTLDDGTQKATMVKLQ